MAMLTAAGAMAETIWVNGNKITGTTTLNTGGGTVSYNATTKVLSIKNVVCDRSGSGNNGIDCKDVTNLTINMSGTNSLKANNASAVICGGRVTINAELGSVTTFTSTAGSQNAIGLYNCSLTLTGTGRLNLESTNGCAVQGREGTSDVTMAIAFSTITSSGNDFYNLSELSIGGSSTSWVDAGLRSSTNILLQPHSSTSVPHMKNISHFVSGTNVSAKMDVVTSVSNLTEAQYATKQVLITNEAVATPDYTEIGDFIFKSSSSDKAVIVGLNVSAKYAATSLLIPGFVTLNGKRLPVAINERGIAGRPNLTYARVAYGVTEIMDNAFFNCKKLQRVDLPGSLTTIGADIVLGTAVKTVFWTTLDPSAVPSLSATAFRTYDYMTSKVTVYLPNAAAAARYPTNASLYCTAQASKDCYDVTIEHTSTFDKYRYVLTKAATASSNGEMALVGLTSGQSTISLNLSTANALTDYLCSYKYDVSYGDKRTYDLTAIAPYALENNPKLVSALMPASTIRSIGEKAFSGCTALKTVNVGQGVKSIGGNAFWGCTGINTLTWNAAAMPDFASSPFSSSASALTTVNIGSTVTTLPKYLLAACDAITTVNWEPANYPDFYSTAAAPFYNSRNKVTTVNFKSSVRHIPGYLCADFSALTQPSVSGNVTSVGAYAFYRSGVTSVSLQSVQSIGNFAFAGTPLKAVTLPSSLTSLGTAAFSGCASLVTVTNNSSINAVKDNTFYGCTSLKSFALNEGVTTIGQSAFYNCRALTSFDLPFGVSSLGSNAFENCTGLTSFSSYPACADISLGANVFYNSTSGCTLHVRPSQLNAYKAANQWKDFFDKVGDLPDDEYNPFDVNNDDAVDVGDVNAILEAILAGNDDAKFNVNGDTAVDVGDVNAVLEYILNN